MNDADVASWNSGIVISSSISSVLGSDHDFKCQEDKSPGTKTELLKDFKQRRAFLTNNE
jgi:hypothetical protein